MITARTSTEEILRRLRDKVERGLPIMIASAGSGTQPPGS